VGRPRSIEGVTTDPTSSASSPIPAPPTAAEVDPVLLAAVGTRPEGRYLRVAGAVPRVRVGDVATNVERIGELIDRAAAEQVAIVTFPELALCGYTIADLVGNDAVLDAVAQGIGALAERTAGTGVAVVVGAPLRVASKLVNAAVVLADGTAVGAVAKRFLPTYSEFYEQRWFTSSDQLVGLPPTSLEVVGVPGLAVEEGLVVRLPDGTRFAVEICEDVWAPDPPGVALARAGAEVVVNLSASNEVLGKADWRRTLVRAQSGRTACAYVYVSCGPTESSADTVFGGDVIVAENGNVVAEGRRYAREPQLVVADVDVASLRHARRHSSTWTPLHPDEQPTVLRSVVTPTPSPAPDDLRREVDAHPFVPDDEARRRERCEEIIELCANGLITAMEGAGTRRAVLGLSGGLDSTLAAITVVRALDLAGWDRSGLTCLVMPGPASSGRTQSNAERLGRELGATVRMVRIEELSSTALAAIGHDGVTEDVAYENTQARLRTLLLMNTANLVGGLVVGTGDLSELALGWCTFNGDHMSMYNVNVGIPKTLVRHVVSTAAAWDEFAAVAPVLHDIVDTPVSPELTGDGDLTQRTEDLVGPYELHDFFLYRTIRHGDAPAAVAYLAGLAFAGRYDDATIARWLGVFLRRFTASQFKRDALPNGPKVGTVALSPRGDWRMSPQTGRWW